MSSDKKSTIQSIKDLIYNIRHLLFTYVALYIVTLITNYIVISYAGKWSEWWVLSDILKVVLNYGGTALTSIFVATVCATIVHICFSWFWHHYVNPELEVYREKIGSELRNSTSSLKSDISNLKKSNKELLINADEVVKQSHIISVVENSTPALLLDNLQLIHKKIFGSHCAKENGLYKSTMNSLYPFLEAMIPHHSQYRHNITIRETEGIAVWNEKTSYEIHVIALDDSYSCPNHNEIDEIGYILEYRTTAKFVDLEKLDIKLEAEDIGCWSLKDLSSYNMDENEIISLDKEYLELAQLPNGEITIHFHIPITLVTGKTKIKMTEKSYLEESDNHYTVRRKNPTFGFGFSISVPDDWNILSFTVPNQTQWGESDAEKNENGHIVKQSIDYNDWVIPGIVASCIWSRNG